MSARRLIVAGALLGALALPGAAHAATASISGSQIVVNAGSNESNNLTISDQGGNVRIVETGFFVTLNPGAGCSSAGGGVNCSRAGIASITVSAGDRGDQIATSSTIPATINAGSGDDDIFGGPANDTINGDADDDAMDGRGGADTLNGGTDTLDPNGNGGDWVSYEWRILSVTADLDGDAGDGEAGENDTIGSDIEHLASGWGDDTLTGNGGQNAFVGGPGADMIRGGSGGTDWAVYWDHSTATTISLDGLANDGSAGEGDNLESGIDNIIGGYGPDTLIGDGAANGLYGQSGNDVLDGGAGPDVLDGSSGSDTVTYASRTAPVTVDLDETADDGEQGEGDNADDDIETLVGGSGGDTLVGTSAGNTLEGGDGDDTLDGGGAADALVGNGGTDTVTYVSRTAPVTADLAGDAGDGEAGENDTIGADVEGLTGGSGNDTLTGSNGDNTLDGGPGSDVMNAGGGHDTVTYASRTASVTASLDGSANDGEAGEGDTLGTDVEALVGGSADDILTGSDGTNRLVGGGGGDTLDPGNGADELDSGAGADTLLARDGAVDSLACGSETDSLEVDSNDEVASDCDVQPNADASAGGTVRIAGRKLRINRRGVAVIPVRCVVLKGICKGTIVVTAKRAKKARKGRAKASRRSRPRRAVIGRASFSAEAGETVKVKVKISRNGRRRVLRNRKLRCRASVKTVAEDGTKNVVEKSLTLLAPKKEDSK